MKISIIHPSRHRPKQMLDTAEKWVSNGDNRTNIEYIFSVDADDNTIPEWLPVLRLPNKSAIEAINNAAEICTGDLIIVVSDDSDCEKGWDTALLKEVEGKSDFVVKTIDGLQPTLVTLPIVDRVWYKRYGYIYHPDYGHMASDVELTAVAIMTGKLIRSNLVFKHLHYSAGLSKKDAINEKNDLTYKQGDAILARHLANNFGIENPIVQYKEIIWQ